MDSLPLGSYDLIVIGGHDRPCEVDKKVIVAGSLRSYGYDHSKEGRAAITATFWPPGSTDLYELGIVELPSPRHIRVIATILANRYKRLLVHDGTGKMVRPGHLRDKYVQVINEARMTYAQIEELIVDEVRSLSIIGSVGQLQFRFVRPTLDEEAAIHSASAHARGLDREALQEAHREVCQDN
ncbi:MAG: hypothetical protein JRI80_00390 [Deltaproteobacteria bacterium]|nr:hypothetical protein [Deltaproteobacteria bacterium]